MAAAMTTRKWSDLLFVTLIVGLGVLPAVGCKNEKAPKTPAPAQAARDKVTDNGDDKDLGDEDDVVDDGEPASDLAIAPESAATLVVAANVPVNVKFNLSGDSGKDVIVGMSEAPAGAAIVKNGSVVTFSWVGATTGSHVLRFILRDRALCEAAESDPSDCDIATADMGKVGAKSYDVSSAAFTLQVGTGTGTGTGTGAGSGALIQQIVQLLGGGGNLQDVLAGMSNGQLQQVLDLAKGGLNIGAITALLGL